MERLVTMAFKIVDKDMTQERSRQRFWCPAILEGCIDVLALKLKHLGNVSIEFDREFLWHWCISIV